MTTNNSNVRYHVARNPDNNYNNNNDDDDDDDDDNTNNNNTFFWIFSILFCAYINNRTKQNVICQQENSIRIEFY